jgi:hypothetical protein
MAGRCRRLAGSAKRCRRSPHRERHLVRLTAATALREEDERLPGTDVPPYAEHDAAGIDEDDRPTEARAEQVVAGEALLGGLVERIEHVGEQLDATAAPTEIDLDRRRSSSVCSERRRVPRGSSNTR